MHKFSCRCTSFRHVVLQIPCRFWKFCVAVLEVSFTRVHELRASTTTEGDLTWLTARTNFSSESKDLLSESSFRRGAQPGRLFFWAQGRKNCAEPEWGRWVSICNSKVIRPESLVGVDTRLEGARRLIKSAPAVDKSTDSPGRNYPAIPTCPRKLTA